MGRVNLFDYNTLVLPSGNYNSFSEGFLDHLKDWLQRGGTIVSLKSASLWLNRAGITNEKMVERPENSDPKALPYADRSAFEGAKAVGGSIYMAKLDLTHPITYGYRRDQLPVYRNSSIFVQPSQNKYLTPVRYTEDPLLGGYISDENLELMKQSASLIISPVGRGRVINFYDSPNFRGTWFGTNKLFLNALFFGDIMD